MQIDIKFDPTWYKIHNIADLIGLITVKIKILTHIRQCTVACVGLVSQGWQNWTDHHITRSKSTGIFMVDSYFYIRTVFKSAAGNVLILFKRKWKRVCTVGVMPHQFNVITSADIAKNEYWIVKQGITVYKMLCENGC